MRTGGDVGDDNDDDDGDEDDNDNDNVDSTFQTILCSPPTMSAIHQGRNLFAR